MAQVVVHRKPGIVIAITAGKDNNAKFHEFRVPGRLRTILAEPPRGWAAAARRENGRIWAGESDVDIGDRCDFAAMQEYDVVFKLILQSVHLTIHELGGPPIARWLNVELPEVRNTRVDLLGETAGGELIHIELQSTNDPDMPLRIAEYCLRVRRNFGKFPEQILVYLGKAPLSMGSDLTGPKLSYSYRIVDIRELDGERLLASPQVGDNIVAILTSLPDRRETVRRIVKRIAGLGPGQREAMLRRLSILAGLRDLGQIVKEEAIKMPITDDIMDHDLIGPTAKQGAMEVLRPLMEERFGPIPAWAEERLSGMHPRAVMALGRRILHAASLEELLQ
jgi:hypothetical protein